MIDLAVIKAVIFFFKEGALKPVHCTAYTNTDTQTPTHGIIDGREKKHQNATVEKF